LVEAGTVIAFKGGLGAGKTAFTRGLARGLGIRDQVTSPTYTLVNEYGGGRLALYHIDAYRLGSADEFELMDAKRYLYGDGLCVVEWSERVAQAMPEWAIELSIEPLLDDARRIRVSGYIEEYLR
jgi:tRNA threonylcarbamoyladenosine biosynthesis protein TsaE